ncbi:uncharacterized protein LOC131161453 isoform X2 [Malania oleifera]|nr:uncharacterized protein LOC131161453 isoform X2 [Malania oleifera]
MGDGGGDQLVGEDHATLWCHVMALLGYLATIAFVLPCIYQDNAFDLQELSLKVSTFDVVTIMGAMIALVFSLLFRLHRLLLVWHRYWLIYDLGHGEFMVEILHILRTILLLIVLVRRAHFYEVLNSAELHWYADRLMAISVTGLFVVSYFIMRLFIYNH